MSGSGTSTSGASRSTSASSSTLNAATALGVCFIERGSLGRSLLSGAATGSLVSGCAALALSGITHAIAHRRSRQTAQEALHAIARDTLTAGAFGALFGTTVGGTQFLIGRYVPGRTLGFLASLAAVVACSWGLVAARSAFITRTTHSQDPRNESAPRTDTHV